MQAQVQIQLTLRHLLYKVATTGTCKFVECTVELDISFKKTGPHTRSLSRDYTVQTHLSFKSMVRQIIASVVSLPHRGSPNTTHTTTQTNALNTKLFSRMKRNPVSESSSIQCTVVSTMPEQTGDIPLRSIGHSVK